MKTTALLLGVAAVALGPVLVSTAQAGPTVQVSFGWVVSVPVIVTLPACPPPVVMVPVPACAAPVVVVPVRPVWEPYAWRGHDWRERHEHFAHGHCR